MKLETFSYLPPLTTQQVLARSTTCSSGLGRPSNMSTSPPLATITGRCGSSRCSTSGPRRTCSPRSKPAGGQPSLLHQADRLRPAKADAGGQLSSSTGRKGAEVRSALITSLTMLRFRLGFFVSAEASAFRSARFERDGAVGASAGSLGTVTCARPGRRELTKVRQRVVRSAAPSRPPKVGESRPAVGPCPFPVAQ